MGGGSGFKDWKGMDAAYYERLRNAALGMDFDTAGYMPDALELSALTVKLATQESIERSKEDSHVVEAEKHSEASSGSFGYDGGNEG